MWRCCALAQHLDRVTGLRDEFTKVAKEEEQEKNQHLTTLPPLNAVLHRRDRE
jgi:hypothetical protein